MADSNLRMRFFGSPEDAERAIISLEKRHDALENKVRQVGRTSQRSTSAGTALIRQQVTQLASLAASYVSVQAGISLVRQGYQAWAQDIDDVSQALGEQNRRLTDQLLLSGDLTAGEELRDFFRGIEGVTQGQAQDLFNSISGAGNDLSRELRKDLTEAFSPLSGVLTDENVRQLGRTGANIAQVVTDRSPEDIADLAVAVSARLGERASQTTAPGFERALRTATTRGLGTEESLAFLTAGIDTGARASTLANLLTKLEEGQGLAELFSGEVQLGQEERGLLDNIAPEVVAGIQAELQAAVAGDAIADARRQAALIDPAGLARQEAAAIEQDTLERIAERMDNLVAGQELRLAQESGAIQRGVLQGRQRAAREFTRTGLEGAEGFPLVSLLNPFAGILQALDRATTREDITAGGTRDQELAALQSIDAGIQQQNERQQINRDAQTE